MGTAAGDYPPGHTGASGADRDRALPGLSEAFHAGPIPAAESGQRSGQALPAAAVMPVASPFDRRVIWVGGIVFAVLMALSARYGFDRDELYFLDGARHLQGLFVFGVDCQLAHLAGATTPLFRGPADRRWWHVVLGDDAANRTVDVRVDEVTGVRFARRPSLFPAWPGQEVLTVQFLGPGGESVLHCFVHDLYDGQRMRPEKLEAWRALRERYGNRDESRVDRGTLLPPAA